MKKYPIGFQDFENLRNTGFLYIDKTQLIHNLVSSGKYNFLSRPRRFGKSLTLSVIKEIFSGKKELFEGLWIYNQWDWAQKHPVIHLEFSRMNYQDHGLFEGLKAELDRAAKKLGISLITHTPKDKFTELIEKVSVHGNVVILIDEYDKAIVDYLDNPEKAAENINIFKNFYSVLKSSDAHIRFLMITGVSRFSKVSIFSDLNNLQDISLHPDYATLTGITQQELETTFAEEIDAMKNRNPNILPLIKDWYNGYSWDGTNTLYNPFSILNFMSARGQWDNYWIDTGTPAFLVKHVRENPALYIFNDKEIIVSLQILKDLDASNPDPVSLMFQTGFLTIKTVNWEQQLFTLDYPNREVKQSVLNYITSAFSFESPGLILPKVDHLRLAFIRNDIPYVIQVLDTLFFNIPSPLWINAKEAFYHGLIVNTFQLLGIYQESEVYDANGRPDVIVKTNTHIYAIEFKLDKGADVALKQIFEKEYLKKFQLDPRKRVAIGINFSSKKKAIADYVIEEVD